MGITRTLIALSLLLIVIVGVIVLQVKLSMMSKRMGFILPVVSLIFSLFVVLAYVSFLTTQVFQTMESNGVNVEKVVSTTDKTGFLISGIIMFLLLNIPTIILYLIYRIVLQKKE